MSQDYQAAWLLHSRPYRETSALAWFFSLEEGRVDAVVRGVRSRKSRYRALLQPFTPLQVRWQGEHSLKNLQGLEASSAPLSLTGEALFCGLYVNELLSRLLLPGHACPGVFREYSLVLNLLTSTDQLEPSLRRFELCLLDFLGAGPSWSTTAGEALTADCYYVWRREQGWQACQPGQPQAGIYSGVSLLAMAADNWQAATTRQAGKQLTRQFLKPLLGTKPLHSRQLFQQFRRRS